MSAPRLTITLPDTPQLDGARRRIDHVRDRTGQVATLAGTAAATTALFAPETVGTSLLATAAVTIGGLATLWLGQPPGHQRATTTVLYLMPGTSLAVLLVAERLVTGIHWAEAVGLAVWSAATWVMRPARIARRMVSPAPPAPTTAPAVQEEVEETVVAHPVAAWWTHNVAVSGGAAPGTLLEDITRTGESSMTATIRAAEAGKPVPEVSIKHLSALMDIPEDHISVTPVPGRGAGVRRLKVGRATESELDPREVWATTIAPKAMPGSIITSIRFGPAPATTAPAPATTVAVTATTFEENA